ncbi:MAG TPA: cytochrome c peroxidase [Steroidobacteraceae bacterium]|nr:cytochrome c peroxidase [Steroidobacteraceae bacterium]
MAQCKPGIAALIGAVILGGTVAFSAMALGADNTGRVADRTPFYANSFARQPSAAALTALGRELFLDPALSASGKVACASCHDPQHDFGPPNAQAVQRGGLDGRVLGVRAVPSLKYTQNVPPFTEHFFDDEGDDSVDQGPAGGRTWDGRSQSFHDQARLPLFSPFEMANAGIDAVVAKVQARYAAKFARIFGAQVFDDKALAFKGVLMALEAYQQSPAEFYPYSSKYDAYLRHETSLSAAELRGLAAFNDPQRGNCARCHPSGKQKGAFPQFTDFGFAAIGAPRNAAIPANAEHEYHDLGLCGPLRTDFKERHEYCGLFRTPSLRNVARRPVFLHNGVFQSLTEVVRFYAERDTQPQKWYPRAHHGSIEKFNDLPAAYLSNLDTQAPFDRRAGDAPALSEQEVEDVVAFLETLNDGFR